MKNDIKIVDLSKLKLFVLKALPLNSTLRVVILSERDSLPLTEYLKKNELWVKLAQLET